MRSRGMPSPRALCASTPRSRSRAPRYALRYRGSATYRSAREPEDAPRLAEPVLAGGLKLRCWRRLRRDVQRGQERDRVDLVDDHVELVEPPPQPAPGVEVNGPLPTRAHVTDPVLRVLGGRTRVARPEPRDLVPARRGARQHLVRERLGSAALRVAGRAPAEHAGSSRVRGWRLEQEDGVGAQCRREASEQAVAGDVPHRHGSRAQHTESLTREQIEHGSVREQPQMALRRVALAKRPKPAARTASAEFSTNSGLRPSGSRMRLTQ